MYKLWSQSALAKDKPKATFAPGLNLRDHVRESRQNGERVYEFIGSTDFGAEWNTRRRFEVDAGRLQVPTLYEPIYNIINDASLPQIIPLYRIGPGGAVLEEVFEGGEVKFMSVSSSTDSVRLHHYGVGLEYSKDLVMYNQLWSVAMAERAVGAAYNALLNHMHFYPILNYSYQSGNDSGAVTSADTDEGDMIATLQAGVTEARTDQTNPRPGPYILLIGGANQYKVERALTRVPQFGVTKQSSVIDDISDVIVYDGWSGTRGRKTTTYSGVGSTYGYLISTAQRDLDFQSYVKQGLEQAVGNPDVSRFILDTVIWDTYFGVYCNPLRSVQRITLP